MSCPGCPAEAEALVGVVAGAWEVSTGRILAILSALCW